MFAVCVFVQIYKNKSSKTILRTKFVTFTSLVIDFYLDNNVWISTFVVRKKFHYKEQYDYEEVNDDTDGCRNRHCGKAESDLKT